MTATAPKRWDAETVVAEILARARDRLTDPRLFTTSGLAGGPSGAALLFGEVSRSDASLRPTAHALLAAEAEAAGRAGGIGILSGLGGLGFAAKHATRSPRDYATLRARIDTALRDGLVRILETEYARIESGTPGADRAHFDVISGVTGLGRYFLAEPAATADTDAVRNVLRYLVALTEPVGTEAGPLPGWSSPPWPFAADERGRECVLDLGLAHGAAGPLALLSLCWTRGLRVPGQDTAVRRIASWLMSWRQEDRQDADAGPWWPGTVTADQELAPAMPSVERGRPSWCYGTPGIARALQLAGTALGEDEWQDNAARAMRALFSHPDRLRGLEDAGLCHGLAGLMQTAGRMAADLDDASLSARADELAERLCARFDPSSAFGFPTVPAPPHRPEPLDSPAYLEGAAGVALALHDRITRPPASDGDDLPWDAALLLA
ncbi:lanthionine synthetase C family protein [Streptomyces sp. NPDC055966]|uniref:lanthionine synthetase C family protein n=1 Tax=Streptomyces sp. NPDC055966 TaxID=3345669 RepID=UPI0035E25071